MDPTGSPLPKIEFPLDKLTIALMKMTPEQRLNASAEKAAEKYDLPVAWCQFEIDHWRKVDVQKDTAQKRTGRKRR